MVVTRRDEGDTQSGWLHWRSAAGVQAKVLQRQYSRSVENKNFGKGALSLSLSLSLSCIQIQVEVRQEVCDKENVLLIHGMKREYFDVECRCQVAVKYLSMTTVMEPPQPLPVETTLLVFSRL